MLSVYDTTINHRQYGNVGIGNTILVDPVLGDDTKGGVNQSPFKTINGALTVAVSGTLIKLAPGTYTETVVLPTGVSLVGEDSMRTKISYAATANTDLLTLSSNSKVQSISLQLTSTGHFQLRAVVYSNTAAADCKMLDVVINVDNSSASSSGTSNVYGIHSNGTSSSTYEWQALILCTITVTSTGLGNKRALLCDTGTHTFSSRVSNFAALGTGSGSFIGIETNLSTVNSRHRLANIRGVNADVSATQGIIQLAACVLINSNANGFPLYSFQIPQIVIFADPGTLPNGTSYMRPGTATSNNVEVLIRIPQNCICRGISAKSVIAPGTGGSNVFTVRRNGVDSTMTVTVSGTSTSAYYQGSSVNYVTGDNLSLKSVSTSSSISDVIITVELM